MDPAVLLMFLLALGYGFNDWPLFASAHDNGLALTPPLGWRSWNLYEGDVHQTQITSIIGWNGSTSAQPEGSFR